VISGSGHSGAGLRPATFWANTLNQYSSHTVPNAFDVIGFAVRPAAGRSFPPLRRLIGSLPARVGHQGQVFEKFFALLWRQPAEHFRLQGDGHFARLLIFAFAFDLQVKAVGPAVFFKRLALVQDGLLHPIPQRCRGIRVAAHLLGQFALSDAAQFKQRAHNRELVRRDAQVRDAAAKCLVQSIPGVAQEDGQAPAAGRVNRHRVARTGSADDSHDII